MTADVVGRADDLAALDAFLGRPPSGPGGLVLEGPAGIGKSTLWEVGVARAGETGLRVLAARPAESESALGLSGLGDLLDTVAGEVLPHLTAPQRRAVEIALVLEEAEDGPAGADGADGEALDPRALGVALRSVLRLLAADQPVLVAVDDVQWLDPASAAALAFALRRLEGGDDVRVLLSRRLEPTAVEAALADRLATWTIEPLSEGALHALLHRRLGRTFPRPTMHRLSEASGGNPFYALELARALLRADPLPTALDPLPLSPTLDRLLGDRLRDLPAPTRDGLLLAALEGSPTTRLLDSAGVPADALRPALSAQVVTVSGDAVRFSHPLLQSAVVAQASGLERRDAHRRLAAVTTEPLARAGHQAAMLSGPDAGVAADLDQAVRTARHRGALALAGQLGEAAAAATPPDERAARARRLRGAARDHLGGGAPDRALQLATALVAEEPPGRPRAEALELLGDLDEVAGRPADAAAHRRQALADSEGEPDLQSRLHEQLALGLRLTETLASALPHAREALRLAESVGSDSLAARAQSTLAVLAFNGGDPAALDLAERGLVRARAARDSAAETYAAYALGHCLQWSGRGDEARAVFTGLLAAALDRDEPGAVDAHWYLALVEERAGRLDTARTHAERALALTRQYGVAGADDDSAVVVPLARVALLQGEHDLARQVASRALVAAEERGEVSATRVLLAVLATLDRWEGRPGEAVDRFEEVEEQHRAAGFGRAMAVWTPELVEGLVELGRTAEARALLDDWDREATESGVRWVEPHARRCRGLLAAATNDGEAALGHLAAAVTASEAVPDPFGRARALVNLGQANRRLKQKRAAREAFEAAVLELDAIGARWWAARARAELGTIGGRTRSVGLTPAEERVAALVAQGRTNREVATTLFLGESTVEKHLSRIYAKLGVRSRTELARRLS